MGRCSILLQHKEQEKEEKGKNHHGKRSKEEQQESYAEILVQLATDNTELFFKDQYGAAFALVKVNNDGDDQHREVIRLESNKFKRYLSKLFYDNQNRRVVNSDKFEYRTTLYRSLKQKRSTKVNQSHCH